MQKKKVLLSSSIFLLLGIAFVTAGFVTNWFSATDEINVQHAVQGLGEGDVIEGSYACLSVEGSDMYMENIAESNSFLMQLGNDAPEGFEVTYKSKLELTKKNVDFNNPIWTIPEDAEKVQVEYTLIGDEFNAEVTENAKEGYVLVYYKDNSDRFNNPAKVIFIENVEGNLPYETDGNAEEYDYCLNGEYDTCHGAKIWYIPLNAINSDGSLDWSRATEFFYESKLIQYNSNGLIWMYPDMRTDFKPSYDLDCSVAEGQYLVTTSGSAIEGI